MRVGLDIGATKVLGAVIGDGGAVVAQARQDTLPGPDGVLESVTRVLDLLTASLDGALPPHIGIGIPGIVDRQRGAVSHAVNLGLGGDWFPLADRLADRSGATVIVENDLNAATCSTVGSRANRYAAIVKPAGGSYPLTPPLHPTRHRIHQ